MHNTRLKSEHELIAMMASVFPGAGNDVVAGIGDDAAVLRPADSGADYLLVTTDMLVEEVHFSRRWADPFQIGCKAAACNLSDIAAMGGRARWMFVSLALPETTGSQWALSVSQGISKECRVYKVAVAGGDTCKGDQAVICITVIGSVNPEAMCLRSQARPGDLVVVTGPLGGSAAGLAMLQAGLAPGPYLKAKHLTPCCRLDIASEIGPLAHAMIDISDGLASEIGHICRQSNVGAVIEAKAIPLDRHVIEAARSLSIDPLQWALGGGEDFELLFTIDPRKFDLLSARVKGLACIGQIVSEAGIWMVRPDGRRTPIEGGFDHFASQR